MKKDKILLHICCGPCATVPIKEMLKEFQVEAYFYNPNIFPSEEKLLRRDSSRKTTNHFEVELFEDDNDYSVYLEAIKGKEANIDKERCKTCYEIRLEKTAQKAKKTGINFFSTSLLISPYQDILAIKEIGEKIALKNKLNFYFKDFRPQFAESRLMAKELELYRQKYCGCSFSKEFK